MTEKDGALKKDEYYQLRINLNTGTLTFSVKLLSIDNLNFITFKDIKGDILNYNLNVISSYKKITKEEFYALGGTD